MAKSESVPRFGASCSSMLRVARPNRAKSRSQLCRPLLPALVSESPAGEGWLHEIKHDGHRTLVVIEGQQIRAFTRVTASIGPTATPALWTAPPRCPAVRQFWTARRLSRMSAVFRTLVALRSAMARQRHRLVFFAFELRQLDGEDLRGRPLVERKTMLQDLIGQADSNGSIQFCEAIEGDGAAIFVAADRMGLEGIVSNRADSRYRSDSSTAWLKTKCTTESEATDRGRHCRGTPRRRSDASASAR